MCNASLKKIIFAMLLVFPAIAFAADEAAIAKAKELVKAGDYKSAYALLEPIESEHAGEVEYDMLLGASGVEGGETSRGIFALERVLDTQPNNMQARILIAKGYFKSGEDENAKKEFNNVLGQKPDPALASIIENNLLAIDKATGQASVFAAYLDFGVGHDSNINSATSAGNVGVSLNNGPLQPFTLTQSSREQSSNFATAAAGISARVPVSKNVAVFGSLAGNGKFNHTTSDFDSNSFDYTVGLNFKQNINTYNIALQGGTFLVDDHSFRDAIGLNGEWQRNLDDHNQISAFGQVAKYEYEGSNDIRDAKRYVIGGAWGHSFDGDKASVIYLSPYVGQENVDKSSVDFLSYSLYGLRLGGQMAINYKLVAFAGFSYENRDYDKTDPVFAIKREDDQYDFNIGLRYLPGNKFTIKPQLSYIDNRSNNNLYEFDRYILSINVRKDFSW